MENHRRGPAHTERGKGMIPTAEVPLLAPDTSKPNILFAPPMGLHLGEAVSYVNRLVEDPALLALIQPLLKQESEGWYVAHRWKAPDGSYSLQVFVWPPRTATRIHDHASWGAYACALGSIFEERYERLDDGSVRDHARLKKTWGRAWNEDDGTSTV